MNLSTWADLHGETDSFDSDPWVCTDPYDQTAVEAARKVSQAWQGWERTVGEDDPALPEWLAFLTALDAAELDIEAARECGCYDCQEGRRDVAGYRADARATAGEFGLPRPPVDGRIPRYPVNVGAIREKGERLAADGAVWTLTEDIYIVIGDTGAYYVHTHGSPEPLDWECSCPWGLPQGKNRRPGRGCAHVGAVHTSRIDQAAAALRAA